MRLVGEKTTYLVSCGKQPRFPTTKKKFQVKRRMECRWVQADLSVIIILIILDTNLIKN